MEQYVRDLPDLRYERGRPLGFFYYGALIRAVGLHFPPWALILQIVGLLNLTLLWLVLRKLRFGDIEAALGCLFFGANSALFDGWWRPAFVYDVLATTFAIATVLAYLHRRWIVSFVAFWLCMRSKEIGIVLPAVLLWYEMTLGERKWKRVLPFFVPAIVYGASGLWFSLHAPRTPYTLKLGLVWKTLRFYSSKLLGIPYAGFALLLSFIVLRDARLYFAINAFICELGIYLMLPGKMLPVYLYLASTAAAIAVAVLASRYKRATIVVVLGWTAWQYSLIRRVRR